MPGQSEGAVHRLPHAQAPHPSGTASPHSYGGPPDSGIPLQKVTPVDRWAEVPLTSGEGSGLLRGALGPLMVAVRRQVRSRLGPAIGPADRDTLNVCRVP